MNNAIHSLLVFLYGKKDGADAYTRLQSIMEKRGEKIANATKAAGTAQGEHETPTERFNDGSGGLPLDEGDAFLITYGDQFRTDGEAPLQTLKRFADRYLEGVLGGIHILPFFPYSSDDGFSIIDYREVNPDFGNWEHIRDIASGYRLAADLVLNHCSAQSTWFKKFREDEEKYRDFFITVDPNTDLSMIVRPRALPLLTAFDTARGKEHVWTTFSADQVDLNFSNPEVLLETADIFLYYIEQGAQMVRLDAIAYLWKEIGHPSIHHEKTHGVVKLFRAIVDEIAPHVVLLTETNVPHKENVSYFGDGNDEAHMVYQFSLPPLVLDAFQREDVSRLRSWASTISAPGQNVTFFNFCASHDGIGLLPAHGIMTEAEIDRMIEEVKKRGGLVSYKATPEGDIPYELNINYRDAVAEKELETTTRAAKFLASQAIMLSMVGVPGIYVHSLIGSGNYTEGVKRTGMNRTINREKLDYDTVAEELETEGTLRNLIYNGFNKMLKARKQNRAFYPTGKQSVLETERALFALLRGSPDDTGHVLCLINAGKEVERFSVDLLFDKWKGETVRGKDLLTEREIRLGRGEVVPVGPYEVLWIAFSVLSVSV